MPATEKELHSIEFANVFPTLFRYLVLAVLYFTVFNNFSKPSIQFILFMVVLILHVFSCVFIFKDLTSTPLLTRAIYDQITEGDLNNWMTKWFVIIVGLTLLLFIASFSIILAVFDYGKKTTNNYESYTLTPSNTQILNQFEFSFASYLIYTAILVYFIIYAHTTGRIKTLMFNIACVVLSVIIIITSVYCCVGAVYFLGNRTHHRQLYQ
jgi:hypothetical protein